MRKNNKLAEENLITIRGARQHNLKNLDLSLPRNKFIVFTGVSGSGKSSLAFDTIFFDEIDNGLSGKSLFSTINLIKKIAFNQQILCITHHPLLAASADIHYKVQKTIIDGLTSTTLRKLLTIKEKQNELAELIGGGFKEASNYALTLINKAAA